MSIPVFYTQKMVSDSGSFSPSSAKPAKVVESWGKQYPIQLIEPTPVSVDDYCKVHDRDFVEGVLSCQQENGFRNKSKEVAATLPYTTGSMLCAALHALETKKVAVSPTSGFHHASYARAQGFCTFNGLMVTAVKLKELELVNTVGILDLDMHYGNGTDDIIEKFGYQNWITHFTAGQHFTKPSQAGLFFKHLPSILEQMAKCDILLYQAGADPHVNDPYGGFLTTDELQTRDRMVFQSLANRVPIAWNLAGGYQIEKDGSIPKVLEIHDNTMKECVAAFIK